MEKRIFINNQIRASQVRVIDENGLQMGVLGIAAALTEARNRGLDLIQVTDKVEPPVCKLGEYGKFLYIEEKKERAARKNQVKTEHKMVKINYNISPHDLETKAHQVEKFIKKNCKVTIQIYLRGRENAFQDLAKQKIIHFKEVISQFVPIKLEQDLQKRPKGFTMIISPGK